MSCHNLEKYLNLIIFKNASYVTGININGRKELRIFDDYNIAIHDTLNVLEPDLLINMNNKFGPYDVIIDDGSHLNSDVIKTFELMFPLLNDGGIYIIEDTVCYKSKNHTDNKFPDHLSYFINYIPYLNQWNKDDSDNKVANCCSDPFKICKKTDNPFEYGIDKIEFGPSYIAIHKLVKTHWIK